MRAHILVTQGGAVQEPEGTVLEVRLGDHPGFGLNEGPPNFAVLESEVPGGDEPIAQILRGRRTDRDGVIRPRFRLEVQNLPAAARENMRRPGPTRLPWADVKAQMRDLD
jgi:hypothetical protein